MKYAVFLRGINISGKNKISMQILKSSLQENGLVNVITYLNSGNIIFQSDITNKEMLSQKIFQIIKEKFNLNISVFITTEVELDDVLNNSPAWWGTNNKGIYDNLIFIIPPANYEKIYSTVGEPSKNIEKIEEYKNHIFWSFDLKNYRKSNWWIKTASTSIKDKITIRTANTIKKVAELCKK